MWITILAAIMAEVPQIIAVIEAIINATHTATGADTSNLVQAANDLKAALAKLEAAKETLQRA